MQPSTNTGTTPLAYLTVLFFDERFNLIPAADGGVYQQQVASSVGVGGASLSDLTGIKAPKNGYVYIYVSNQSNQDVYFDNLAVTIAQGNIIEENHYYAFGLKIAAISSKKFADSYDGNTKNNYQMQGAFSEMDDDIGWNDFALRNYDPQIGRWVQVDPYDEFASPYVGMGNDPSNCIDPSGGGIFTGMSFFGKAATCTILGAIGGEIIGGLTGDDSGRSVGMGALLGFAASLTGSFDWAYLLRSASTINFFVTQSVHVRSKDHLGLGALNADLTWARTKAFFSFGRLKIISEETGDKAAAKIAEICQSKNKTVGSIILESHAHSEVAQAYGNTDQGICNSYDPATTSLALGGDDMSSRIDANTNLNDVGFFTTLKPFVTEQTNVFLGNCWSGHPAFHPVLQNISNFWNNASVYGHAAECRTSSLFLKNTFYSKAYSNSSDAKLFTNGFHPRIPDQRGAHTSCLVKYNEIGNNGIFYRAKDGNVRTTSTVYFGKAGDIHL